VSAQLRLVIADDHEPMRAEVRGAVERDGRFVVVAEAADAAAAVAAALSEQPDLCLLDVHMPGKGVSAAWEISSRLPAAKVVMLTVSDDDEDLMLALGSGVAGYLLKGMDMRRLPDALWDIHQGTFTMPRQLMGRVVERFRDTAPRRRAVQQAAAAEPRLTTREWEVLDLLARGLSTAEIAERLSLTPTGVRVHTSAIVKKLGARDRDEAIAMFRDKRR
jgi:DNA-binding NarL/FixJ family response regulator